MLFVDFGEPNAECAAEYNTKMRRQIGYLVPETHGDFRLSLGPPPESAAFAACSQVISRRPVRTANPDAWDESETTQTVGYGKLVDGQLAGADWYS